MNFLECCLPQPPSNQPSLPGSPGLEKRALLTCQVRDSSPKLTRPRVCPGFRLKSLVQEDGKERGEVLIQIKRMFIDYLLLGRCCCRQWIEFGGII